MGLITVKHKGSFTKAERFFNRALRMDYLNVLEKYGQKGVEALRNATPKSSGKTAAAWDFGFEKENGKITLYWTNSHEENGLNIAILLIYGHGLQNGGYVEGNDFVSPAVKSIFEDIADQCWKEVTR